MRDLSAMINVDIGALMNKQGINMSDALYLYLSVYVSVSVSATGEEE